MQADPSRPHIDDEKYIVFKREALEEIFDELFPETGAADVGKFRRLLGQALTDTVVIRKQDMFAAAGLHSYADAMTACIELMTMMGIESPAMDAMSEVREYFKQQAWSAETWPTKKIPTP